MQPLQCETTVLSIQKQCFSSFFQAFFKTSFRTGILSNFDRFLVIWGLHLETLGSTFEGHFFRSQKNQKGFFRTRSWGGAILDTSGRRGKLGGIWETFGRHLGQRRPGRGSEGNCTKTYVFFCRKRRVRAFRVHESDLTLTKSAACEQKLAGDRGEIASKTLMDILT